jgi:predicted Fe-S protein YdhL (DUF1289 family)
MNSTQPKQDKCLTVDKEKKCVNKCKLDKVTNICLTCKRHIDEIIAKGLSRSTS